MNILNSSLKRNEQLKNGFFPTMPIYRLDKSAKII